MRQQRPGSAAKDVLKTAGLLTAMLVTATALSGCLVAGYSSGSGFFIWPGSIVITLLAVLLFVLMRRGR